MNAWVLVYLVALDFLFVPEHCLYQLIDILEVEPYVGLGGPVVVFDDYDLGDGSEKAVKEEKELLFEDPALKFEPEYFHNGSQESLVGSLGNDHERAVNFAGVDSS